MNPDVISSDLRNVLRRLKLSRLLDTLPERLALARQQKMPHQDFLLLVLQDEASRRDTQAASLRAQKAQLDPAHQLENWDATAKVSFDRELLNELASLRFVESNHHVAIVGHVGVGKTFLAHALGHVACRRGHSVLAVQADRMLKTLKQARLLNAYEAELRKLVAVDLLVVDDFALDAMDAQESRDTYEIFSERHRSGSMIVTSNRGPDEWLATFADPLRAQSAVDRFTNNAYDLVIEGESYRSRLKPSLLPVRAVAAEARDPCTLRLLSLNGNATTDYGTTALMARRRFSRRQHPCPRSNASACSCTVTPPLRCRPSAAASLTRPPGGAALAQGASPPRTPATLAFRRRARVNSSGHAARTLVNGFENGLVKASENRHRRGSGGLEHPPEEPAG